jgi:hypothetical protein
MEKKAVIDPEPEPEEVTEVPEVITNNKNNNNNLRSNSYRKIPQLSSDTQSLAIRALFVLGVAVIALAIYSQRRSLQTTGGKSQ